MTAETKTSHRRLHPTAGHRVVLWTSMAILTVAVPALVFGSGDEVACIAAPPPAAPAGPAPAAGPAGERVTTYNVLRGSARPVGPPERGELTLQDCGGRLKLDLTDGSSLWFETRPRSVTVAEVPTQPGERAIRVEY